MGQILGESHGFYENRREDQPLLTATNEGGDHNEREKIFEEVGTPLCILYYHEKDVVIQRD